VQDEIRKAESILERMDAVTVFDSPYLISAIYYNDGFLRQYPEDKQDADPARRIIAHIARSLTPQRKAEFVRVVHEVYDAPPPAARRASLLPPVPLAPPSRRRLRRTHPHAVDLFAPEGSAVRSASPGVVLLAESGWTEADPFSTSSHAGGNSVIVFDFAANRFYRYCHLQSVRVIAGAAVEAGYVIGAVGHTGLNASRGGHGRHLHFEVNEYNGETIRPLTYKEIWGLLQS
jgi:murein DD-endopeptidase MepM/ murein hydrolase activator NlpD